MLEDVPLLALFVALFILLLFSAFFSSSETALMSLNRYRLRHLKEEGHKGAILASRLLSRPDRLIGLILLGNNFVNILASAIATIIGVRLYGENGIVVATFMLTLIILLFAEVSPKTLAALHPERVAFPASFILRPLSFLLYPLIWLINIITNRLLALFGVSPAEQSSPSAISSDELRIALKEAGSLIPNAHKNMLVSILDLEKITVNDVMIPRNEIAGLNLDDALSDIIKQLSHSKYTRLPVYKDGIDNIVGTLHVKHALNLLAQNNFNKESLTTIIKPPYFVPENTKLNTQLIQFQQKRRHTGLVVDEYGDIFGMITLEDIFAEIVGKFTADLIDQDKAIHPQQDGSYLINGSANIRDINRNTGWHLPTDGAKTMNGMVLEYLENIPDHGVSLRVEAYIIEVVQTKNNTIKLVRVYHDKLHPTHADKT